MIVSKDGHDDGITQKERFEQAAKELEADENEANWEKRLKKVMKPKPAPEKSK